MSQCRFSDNECGRNPKGGCNNCVEFWKEQIKNVLPDKIDDLKIIYCNFKYPLIQETGGGK